jgi:hypothetical protein
MRIVGLGGGFVSHSCFGGGGLGLPEHRQECLWYGYRFGLRGERGGFGRLIRLLVWLNPSDTDVAWGGGGLLFLASLLQFAESFIGAVVEALETGFVTGGERQGAGVVG